MRDSSGRVLSGTSAAGAADGDDTVITGDGNQLVFLGAGDDNLTTGDGTSSVFADTSSITFGSGGTVLAASSTTSGSDGDDIDRHGRRLQARVPRRRGRPPDDGQRQRDRIRRPRPAWPRQHRRTGRRRRHDRRRRRRHAAVRRRGRRYRHARHRRARDLRRGGRRHDHALPAATATSRATKATTTSSPAEATTRSGPAAATTWSNRAPATTRFTASAATTRSALASAATSCRRDGNDWLYGGVGPAGTASETASTDTIDGGLGDDHHLGRLGRRRSRRRPPATTWCTASPATTTFTATSATTRSGATPATT